jgi:murein DD-endopeptidase MepM/ murein hydrolase activator NlpD
LPGDKATAFFRELKQQQGDIKHLGKMRHEEEWAVFAAQFERGTLDLKMALDESNRINGLLFLPARLGKKAPARNETRLSLPCKGRWLVFWGGDTSEMNQHHDEPNQKFAFDIDGVDDNGRTRRGQTNDNEDYFAFGREVLAPADGVVVEAIDGVRDNEPGAMNPYWLVGNCIVIQHRDNEFSVLAHLKQGSVRAKAGEKVKCGDVLGLCGNSGNSSEPHLHYHLQHESRLPEGFGIKAFFERVVIHKDGKSETRSDYSPIKGDVISPE